MIRRDHRHHLADCTSRFAIAHTHTHAQRHRVSEFPSPQHVSMRIKRYIMSRLSSCALCCRRNVGRISPIFVVIQWRRRKNGAQIQMRSIVETTTNHLCVRFGRFFPILRIIIRLNCNANEKWNTTASVIRGMALDWVGFACVHIETIKWNGQMSFRWLRSSGGTLHNSIYSFVFNLCRNELVITHCRTIHNRLFLINTVSHAASFRRPRS